MATWKDRAPTDPVAYAFGVLMVFVFLSVQGPIVGAIIGAALATASCLIGLRIVRMIWLAITPEPPER